MKLECVVIACHNRAVNTSLLLAHTARHIMEAGIYRSRRKASKQVPVTGMKS